MDGMGAGPGAPGQARNVAAGGYPSQQGGKGGPAVPAGQGQQAMGAAASNLAGRSGFGQGAAGAAAQMMTGAGQNQQAMGDAARQMSQGIGQMRQQADAQAFYDAARANPNADWEAAKQHDSAVKAHGEGAVSDFYNSLMQQGQQGKAPMPAQGRNPNKGQPAGRGGR